MGKKLVDLSSLNIEALRKLSFGDLCKTLGVDRKHLDKQLLLNIFHRFISSEASLEVITGEDLLKEFEGFWNLFKKLSPKELANIAQAIHHDGANSTVLEFVASNGWDVFIAHTLKDKFSDNKVPGINAQTARLKESALHAAANSGHVNTVNILLALGADSQSKNARGKTPADLAIANGCINAFNALNAGHSPSSTAYNSSSEESSSPVRTFSRRTSIDGIA